MSKMIMNDLSAAPYSSSTQQETNTTQLEHRIEEVLVALRRVIRATDLHSKHLAKTTGLTAPQILILQTIRNLGQVTIGEIAHDVSLSQATVTTILDRLEKRELIYRKRSLTDRRKVHAYLTEDAEEILQGAPIPLQDQLARQFGHLKEWEQTMLISSLQRVAQMMDAHDIDAAPVLDVGKLDRQSHDHHSPWQYDDIHRHSTNTKK